MKTRLLIVSGIVIAFTITFFILGHSQGHVAQYFLTDEQLKDIILNNGNTDRYSIYDESNNTSDQLKGIFGNCACQERVKTNSDTVERCPQPFIDWKNSTHYIDNNICEWRELENEN